MGLRKDRRQAWKDKWPIFRVVEGNRAERRQVWRASW